MKRKLGWAQIKNGLANFAQMTGKGEVAFFRKAWDCLRLAGLTVYADELGRVRGAMQAYTLGLIWSDFYDLQWDEVARETREEAFRAELADLGVSPKSLLELAQADCGFVPSDNPPGDSDLWSAAQKLNRRYRGAINGALCRGFGSEQALKEAMYVACVPDQRDELADQASEFIDLGFELPWESGATMDDD